MTEGVLPRTRRGKWFVVAALALALALRVGVVAESRSWFAPITDSEHFDYIATEIANGRGFGQAYLPPAEGPSAIRAPLYPFVLAVVYAVFGDGQWTMGRLANAAIGTAAVALVGLVAAQLCGRRVGAVALALAAVYPPLILTGTSLELEPLLVLLSLGALAAALQHRRQPRGLWWPVVTGVLIGLAVLTRELGFFLVPTGAWLVWTAADRRPRFTARALAAPVAVVVAGFCVVIPWTIRNAVRLDAFVPVTTSSGFGLVGTYNATSEQNRDTPGIWIEPWRDPATAEVMLRREHPTEVQLDRDLREASLEFIADHPTYPFRVALWNSIRLLDLDGGDYSLLIAEFVPWPRSLTKAAVAAGYVMMAAAAVGAFLRPARRIPKAFWLVPLLNFLAFAFTLPGSIRYRASLEPFFILLASITVVAVYDQLAPRREKTTGTAPG